jgi:hypothetical protein
MISSIARERLTPRSVISANDSRILHVVSDGEPRTVVDVNRQ